jgi:hypothetical protein
MKLKSMPNSAYYIPDFINEAEEDLILKKVRFPSPSSHQNKLLNGVTDKQPTDCNGS